MKARVPVGRRGGERRGKSSAPPGANEPTRIGRLAKPPRRVPLAAACSAMLGLTGKIGGIFLAMGSGFGWILVRRGIDHPFPLVLAGIFPVVGLVLFGGAAISGVRQIVLLRYGEVADARRAVKRTSNTVVDGRPVVGVEYEFVSKGGLRSRGVARTVTPHVVGDEQSEPVLYLPSDPRVSVLVDALPSAHPLDVDDDGQWVSYDGMGPVVWLGLIWTAIALSVSYGLLLLLGLA